MRLPKFEDAIVRADANYFLGLNFISADLHYRVKAWLDGTEDPVAKSTVVNWLNSDADYGDEVKEIGARTLWHIAPAVRLGLSIISARLRSQAAKLQRGTG